MPRFLLITYSKHRSGLFSETGSGPALKSKYISFRGVEGSGCSQIEVWRLMEPWRVYRPVVTDSYYFDEYQDPDPQ